MQLQTLFITLFIFLNLTTLSTQNLSQHQWKNRLVLIITKEQNNPIIQQQITAFQQKAVEMKERKLLVYHILPHQYRIIFPAREKIKHGTNLYQQYNKNDTDFEVILIGLDGGTKLRQLGLLTTEVLFSLIDGMPMRRREMRNRP